MCYICEARGTVGKNYKAAQKEITRALRVWGRVAAGERRRPDWQSVPTAQGRLWSIADLKRQGEAWRRDQGLTQGRVTP